MLTYYYLATLVASIICFGCLMAIKGKTQLETNFLFMFLMVITANSGYYALVISKVTEEAVLALKISYAGGCFLAPIFMMIIFEMCNVRMPLIVRFGAWLAAYGIFFLASTIGKSDIYYKSEELIFVDGGAVLLREYGQMHIFFPLFLLSLTVFEISFTIYAILRKKNVSYKNLLILLGAEVAMVGEYLISKQVDNSYIIFEPLFYIIGEVLMLYMIYRLRYYNLKDTLLLSNEIQKSVGYITLDTRGKFLNASPIARQMLPELEKCRVDSPIPSDVPALVNLLRWRDELQIKERFRKKQGLPSEILLTKEFSVNSRHYKVKIKPIEMKNGKVGAYFYELTDDTTQFNYSNLLSSYNSQLEETVKEKTEHIADIRLQMVIGMSDVIESRDGDTGGHVKRTSDITAIMIKRIREFRLFDMDEQFCNDIVKAAPMHDLGKIAIPDAILNKKGKLTKEEFEIMKTHAAKGGELVTNLLADVEETHFVNVVKNIATYHHERWDGSGYPDGLRGREIPFEARIMAIADVYDALVSKRSYKDSVSFEDAYKIIMDSMGSHFDPDLGLIFELCHKDFEKYYLDEEAAPMEALRRKEEKGKEGDSENA